MLKLDVHPPVSEDLADGVKDLPAFSPARFPRGIPEMTKSGFSNPRWPISESSCAAEVETVSTLPLWPAILKLSLQSRGRISISAWVAVKDMRE